MITDDRGHPIRVRFRGLPIVIWMGNRHGSGRGRSFVLEIPWLFPIPLVPAALLLVAGVAILCAPVLGWSPTGTAAAVFRVIGLAFAAVGGIVVFSRASAAMASEEAFDTLLAARDVSRRCGACAHSLAGRTPAEDGRVECPRCGAAWRRRDGA